MARFGHLLLVLASCSPAPIRPLPSIPAPRVCQVSQPLQVMIGPRVIPIYLAPRGEPYASADARRIALDEQLVGVRERLRLAPTAPRTSNALAKRSPRRHHPLMNATARSFYLIEASSFPPMHLFIAYAYVDRDHVRLVLDGLSEMAELVANSDLLALWVVQNGVVASVVDLKEACEVDEQTGSLRLLTEAIVDELPDLEGTLLRPHERSVVRWSPDLSLFDAARESPLFDENHCGEFQLGAEGRGDLTGEDVTPPGLQNILGDEAR